MVHQQFPCPSNATDPGPPGNIVDACGNTITPVLVGSTSNPSPVICNGTVVWTYQYTACDGTTADWTYTYTVTYSGGLTPPANGSSTVACPSNAVDPGSPGNIIDACGNSIAPVLVGSTSNPSPIICDGTVIWTYRYTACDGTTADWTFTYTVTNASGLTPPADGSSNVSCPADAIDPGSPGDIIDACGNTVSPSLIGSTSNPSPVTCNGTIVWTYTYTACDGTTVDWTYTYNVTYSGGLTPPANGASTVSCPSNATDPGPPSNITDACGRSVTPVLIGSVSNPSPITCNGTVVWTYRYTACDGTTTADWTYTYTVTYSGVLTPPANGSSTVSCPSNAVDPGPPANIIDACGNSITPVLVGSTSNPSPITCNGTVVWTYRYTACDGSTADWTYTYTVTYSGALTPPVNGSSTVPCPTNAVDPGSPGNITDACGNTIVPVLVGSTSNPSPVTCSGTVVWTYRYTACDGSTADWTYTYTVNPPTFVLPAAGGSTVACISDAQAVPVPPNVNNSCGSPVSAVGPVIGPDPVCSGTKTYTWTYTDCDGTAADWVYTYTISPPSLTLPADGSSTVPCISDAQVIPTPPSINSSCGDPVIPTGPVVGPDPVCSGTKTYTWTYTDCSGSFTPWIFTYTISPPTLVLPADGSMTVACISDAQIVPTPPNVNSSCGDPVIPTGPVVGPDPMCSGPKTYTWTYTDCTGNAAEWVYTYTISPPTFSLPGNGSSIVACIIDAQAVPSPPIVNNSCGDPVVPVGPVIGSDPLCSGTKTYTWTYTDCTGNSLQWVYTYNVSPPTFTIPADDGSTVACISDAQVVPTPPTVNNSCNDPIVPTGPVISPDPPCAGTKTYTWTYMDCTG